MIIKLTLSDAEVQAIIEAARVAANAATITELKTIGGDQYPCGFAWVNIKPARGQFVKVLKQLKLGAADEYNGGFTIWNPSGHPCQHMDAKIAGAKIFAQHLQKHGVNITVNSRMD